MDNNEKPIILKLRDFEEQIVNMINNSGIPAFILKSSIEKVLRQLELLEVQEFSKASEEYNIAKENKEGKAKE